MTAEENRDYGNLILLCRADAKEIDDIPDDYPPHLLREWKRFQVAAQKQAAMLQPALSDVEVAEVVRCSFGLDEVVAAIAEIVPHSPRSRSRHEALDLAVRQSQARRSTRLPIPHDRVDAVLMWMAEHADQWSASPKARFAFL